MGALILSHAYGMGNSIGFSLSRISIDNFCPRANQMLDTICFPFNLESFIYTYDLYSKSILKSQLWINSIALFRWVPFIDHFSWGRSSKYISLNNQVQRYILFWSESSKFNKKLIGIHCILHGIVHDSWIIRFHTSLAIWQRDCSVCFSLHFNVLMQFVKKTRTNSQDIIISQSSIFIQRFISHIACHVTVFADRWTSFSVGK